MSLQQKWLLVSHSSASSRFYCKSPTRSFRETPAIPHMLHVWYTTELVHAWESMLVPKAFSFRGSTKIDIWIFAFVRSVHSLVSPQLYESGKMPKSFLEPLGTSQIHGVRPALRLRFSPLLPFSLSDDPIPDPPLFHHGFWAVCGCFMLFPKCKEPTNSTQSHHGDHVIWFGVV